MKTLAALALAALALGSLAPVAAVAAERVALSGLDAGWGAADSQIEKRRRPRVPGGSGCDDAGDAREHPECRR